MEYLLKQALKTIEETRKNITVESCNQLVEDLLVYEIIDEEIIYFYDERREEGLFTDKDLVDLYNYHYSTQF